METGPGKWEEEEGGESVSFEEWIEKPSKYVRKDTTEASPTFAHYALNELLEDETLKFIIS